jgi:hypothetical protein
MARNDVTFFEAGGSNYPGDRTFATAASSTALYKGEPTLKALAGAVVAPLATSSPAIGTSYTAGITASDSNHTATAAV